MTLGNMSNVVGSALITPLDALFDAQPIFLCAAVVGTVALVLLFWLPSVSEDTPTAPDARPSS
jgi:predicted MFS family arabinose efflux permease